MREVKFRVWDENAKIFHYWGFTEDGVFQGITTGRDLNQEDVKRLSEQYTGLRDKNGVEIYEGDVLRVVIKNSSGRIISNVLYHVIYENCGFKIKNNKTVRMDGFAMNCTTFEIIGNIHENKELLK